MVLLTFTKLNYPVFRKYSVTVHKYDLFIMDNNFCRIDTVFKTVLFHCIIDQEINSCQVFGGTVLYNDVCSTVNFEYAIFRRATSSRDIF